MLTDNEHRDAIVAVFEKELIPTINVVGGEYTRGFWLRRMLRALFPFLRNRLTPTSKIADAGFKLKFEPDSYPAAIESIKKEGNTLTFELKSKKFKNWFVFCGFHIEYPGYGETVIKGNSRLYWPKQTVGFRYGLVRPPKLENEVEVQDAVTVSSEA